MSSNLVLPIDKDTMAGRIHMVLPYDKYVTASEIAERTGLTLEQVSTNAPRLLPVCLAERKKNEVREGGKKKRMFMYKGFSEKLPRSMPQSLSIKKPLEKSFPEDWVIPPQITEQTPFNFSVIRSSKQIRAEGDRFDGSKPYATELELKKIAEYVYASWVKQGKPTNRKPMDTVAEFLGVHAYGDGSNAILDGEGIIKKEWIVIPDFNLPATDDGARLRLKFIAKSSASKELHYDPLVFNVDREEVVTH